MEYSTYVVRSFLFLNSEYKKNLYHSQGNQIWIAFFVEFRLNVFVHLSNIFVSSSSVLTGASRFIIHTSHTKMARNIIENMELPTKTFIGFRNNRFHSHHFFGNTNWNWRNEWKLKRSIFWKNYDFSIILFEKILVLTYTRV